MEFTPRQRQAVAAHVAAGGAKGAAHDLGITGHTLHRHLAGTRERLHVATTTQAAVLLASRGELVVDVPRECPPDWS